MVGGTRNQCTRMSRRRGTLGEWERRVYFFAAAFSAGAFSPTGLSRLGGLSATRNFTSGT